MRLERIGIFGGTFDPVHRGHLALARAALRELKLDRLFWIPARVSPFKSAPPFHSVSQRVQKLKKTLANSPRFQISLFEVRRPGPSYMVQTVKFFSKKYPGSSLYLVLGADALQGFTRWKNWKEILKFCRLAAGRRPGFRLKVAQAVKKNLIVLKSPMPDVSSTEIRKKIAHAKTK